MEKYYLQTVGAQIITGNGERIGRIGDVILNPDSGKIVGFLVAPRGRKIIAPVDITSWTNFIRVHDIHDIVDIDEVQQAAKIMGKNIPVFKSRVFTKDGDYIGRVIDFGIDNKFFTLTCLIVAKGFMGIFFWDRKIIAVKDIIEITKKGIIIKNLVKPVKMKKLRVDMATPTPQI